MASDLSLSDGKPGLWQQPVFVGLFASTLLMALGSQIYQLALPLILYELTRSLPAMTALRALEFLPNLLLAAFIGVWVDRVCRRRWAQRSLLAMGALAGAAGAALALGWLPLWLFYPLAFVMMLCNYVTAICRMGLVKSTVPQDLLMPATSYLNMLFNVFAVSGPMLSGLLIAYASLAWGLLLPALLFMLSALALQRVPAPPYAAAGVRHFWQELAGGWQALRANRALWQLAWMVVLANGASGMAELLFLFRARDTLGLSAAELGVMYGVAGVGGILAGLGVTMIRQRLGLGRVIVLAFALEGLGMLALTTLHSVPWLLAVQFASSFAVVCGNVCVWSYRQESTPVELIGRVSGLTGSLFKLLMPLTLWASGLLSSSWPLSVLMQGAALLSLLAAAGCAIGRVGRLR